MRLDCLTSAIFPSEFASREVVTLLDRDGSSESESCCGEDGGKLSDGGIGAKIGSGKSSYEDRAYAVFAQNKKVRAIAAQALRAKREIVRSDREQLM
jgi:hypothetical protein